MKQKILKCLKINAIISKFMMLNLLLFLIYFLQESPSENGSYQITNEMELGVKNKFTALQKQASKTDIFVMFGYPWWRRISLIVEVEQSGLDGRREGFSTPSSRLEFP